MCTRMHVRYIYFCVCPRNPELTQVPPVPAPLHRVHPGSVLISRGKRGASSGPSSAVFAESSFRNQ